MSDLISREGILEYLKTVTVTEGITFETGFKQILHDIETQPSADIMECARAIKEYCEKERINCAECPFYNRERNLSCVLCDPCMSWDLPEGEKE